jgi:hypothetical protein
VERLIDDSSAAEVSPAAARRYFGEALVFDIEPARLRRRISDFVASRGGALWMGRSFLDAADWSGVLTPVERSPVHQEITALIAADLDYRKTYYYRRQGRRISQGSPIFRNGLALSTRADLDAYYEYCIALIESAREHGIVPRGRIGHFAALALKHRRVRPALVDRTERNIGVAINEDGELVRHLGGKHRTAIAQTLGLATMPVELQLVHVGWLAKEMQRTGLRAHKALARHLRRLRADH